MNDSVPTTSAFGEPRNVVPQALARPAAAPPTRCSTSALSVPSLTRVSFPLPAEWANESRKLAMFAAFGPRNDDPRAYDKKMQFWQNVILEYCEHKGEAHFSKRELHLVFGNNERRVHCLDTVLAAMQRTKMTRRRLDYEYDPEDTWTGWTANFMRRPVLWGQLKLRRLTGGGAATNSNEIKPEDMVGWEDYVHIALMRNYADELLQQLLLKRPAVILDYDFLQDMVRAEFPLPLSEDCVYLCLLTLYAQQKIGLAFLGAESEHEIELIKVPPLALGKARGADIHISSHEQTMYRLNQSAARITKQMRKLDATIRETEMVVSHLLSEQRHANVMPYLRRKLLLKKGRRQRSLVLRNVNSQLLDLSGENGGRNSFRRVVRDALRFAGLKFGNMDETIADCRDSEMKELLDNKQPSETLFTVLEIKELEEEFMELVADNTRIKRIVGNNTVSWGAHPFLENHLFEVKGEPACDFDLRLNKAE